MQNDYISIYKTNGDSLACLNKIMYKKPRSEKSVKSSVFQVLVKYHSTNTVQGNKLLSLTCAVKV